VCTPQALAAACLRVIREPGTAARIAAAGHALWKERYQPSVVRARVATVARAAAG